jgi:predicted nucleotidyltransferase
VLHNEDVVTLSTLTDTNRSELMRLAAAHGARNVRVFGSVARGEAGPRSDLDLLVDLEDGRTLFDLAGFAADVEDLLGVRVDVVTPRSLRYLRDRILSEAVSI